MAYSQRPKLTREDVSEMKRKRDVKGLLEAIRYKGNVWIRHDAAEALGDIGNKQAVKPLIAVLKSQNEEQMVRGDAALALGKLGAPQAVRPLIKAFADHGLTKFAISALEHIGTPAVKPLIKALKNKDHWVRQSAAEALGKIGDEQAVPPLIKALRDGNNYAASSLKDITGWAYTTDADTWHQWWSEKQQSR